MSYVFSSESVGSGHPDKLADAISDAILDDIIAQDPDAHVACETMVTTGLVIVGGEISTKAYCDVPSIVRKVVNETGYNSSEIGFDGNSCGIITTIDKQSPDINQGVSRENPEEQGAGDQGLMFGGAVDETPNLMPAPIYYAHKLVERVEYLRKNNIGTGVYYRPDTKSQVSIEYDDNGTPSKVVGIVMAIQHSKEIPSDFNDGVIKNVIMPVFENSGLSIDFEKCNIIINGTGKFVIGGPVGDCGLTGRKIIVDTYGGYFPHGGGAFSGKDPSKVDRSGAYMARYIAKNIVGAKLARKCQVEIAYAIGKSHPMSVYVTSFGTSNYSDEFLTDVVKKNFDLRPYHIIEHLKLKRPIYSKTTNFGHFGKEGEEFTWEKLDMVDKIKEYISKRS